MIPPFASLYIFPFHFALLKCFEIKYLLSHFYLDNMTLTVIFFTVSLSNLLFGLFVWLLLFVLFCLLVSKNVILLI